jgi:hypothetical protein
MKMRVRVIPAKTDFMVFLFCSGVLLNLFYTEKSGMKSIVQKKTLRDCSATGENPTEWPGHGTGQ